MGNHCFSLSLMVWQPFGANPLSKSMLTYILMRIFASPGFNDPNELTSKMPINMPGLIMDPCMTRTQMTANKYVGQGQSLDSAPF